MAEKRTAYIVTCGEYSDYSISAVFLDKALADRYADVLGRQFGPGSGYRVEEHEIKQSVARRVTVHGLRCNTADGVMHEWDYEEWEDEAPQRPKLAQRPGGDGNIMLRVTCVDPELARKAFQDRLARFQAQRAGVAD